MDKKIVLSVVIGLAAFGAVMYVLRMNPTTAKVADIASVAK